MPCVNVFEQRCRMHPASFRFTQGTIRTTKGSAIANLVSLEVHVFRYVARKIYSYKTCLFSVVRKNPFHNTSRITLIMGN